MQTGDQRRQIGRIMGEVGVHLENGVVSVHQRLLERLDVGSAQTQLPGPMDHADTRVLNRQFVRKLPGAIRRIIVHDPYSGIRQLGTDGVDDRRHIVTLVIGRQDNQHAVPQERARGHGMAPVGKNADNTSIHQPMRPDMTLPVTLQSLAGPSAHESVRLPPRSSPRGVVGFLESGRD